MATKFNSKAEAAAAVEKFNIPLAGPVAIVPMAAKLLGVTPGWYIGFPMNISRDLVDLSAYGA